MTPTIGIIGGKGRMGRLFANFFKERGLQVLISDLKTKLNNKELAQKSDIVIVSVPIDKTEQVIKKVLPYIKKGSAIMDFTSVKEMPIKAMLKGECEVLGIHPMFGNSNPIPSQTIIVCPTKKSGPHSEWLKKFLLQNKVKIHEMTASEHDKIMSIAQGLIHFADIAFADGLQKSNMPIKDLLKYTSKASELKIELAARLIDQDPGLYANIQIANPHTLKALKNYKKSIDDLIKIVQKKDLQAFKKYFNRNQKVLGSYTKKAYQESSYLIDQLIQKQRRKPPAKQLKPSKNHLATLGPKNTFSDIAADSYLKVTNKKLKKHYTKDIEEIFELVEKGKVDSGIVPIENKLNGTVRETLDSLFSKNVHISDEINIPIHHALIILPHAKKSDIKTVISHTQALNQCKSYLKKNFAKATKAQYSSTAAAVNRLLSSNNRGIAVIAPAIAAEANDLKILDNNIEDQASNSTTFVVINKGKTPKILGPSENPKTSIAFYFKADSPGSLFSVFQDFAKAKLNMAKIESRPTRARFGEYVFYLDFDGHISEAKVKKALSSVGKKVAQLKILGSY